MKETSKEILIRNLNSPKKADLKSILDEYIQRDYVGTSTFSGAVEKMIREFHKNEGETFEKIQQLKSTVKELETKVRKLSDENYLFKNKQVTFINALNELIKV